MAGILPEVRCDRSTERALQRLMEPAGSGACGDLAEGQGLADADQCHTV